MKSPAKRSRSRSTKKTAKSPAKRSASTKKRSTSAKRGAKTGPTTKEMITTAIKELHERGGSSRIAIRKYLQDNYDVNYPTFASQFRQALARGVEAGYFIQSKQSFRLSPNESRKAGSTAPKRAASTKRAKSPAKKTAATKRSSSKKSGPEEDGEQAIGIP